MSDRILGGACLILAVVYIFLATQTKVTFLSDPLGPRPFPVAVGLVLGIASLITLLRPDIEPNWPQLGSLLEIIFAVVIMLGYATVMPIVGFLSATAVAATLLSWRMGANPVRAGVAGTSISAGIFVIFHYVLGLSLAIGPWGI